VAARHGFVVAAIILVMPAAPLGAQVTVVDEGTFSLLTRGTRTGREDFSIRRTTGGGIVAQGNLLRGDSRATIALATDSSGAPERFRMETLRSGRREEEISGERRGNIWSGLALRLAGERGSEFRIPTGALVADEDAVHHLWFLLHFAPGRSAARLKPRGLSVDTVVVEAAGNDRVTIGLEELDARKFIVRSADGRGAIREVWTDAEGRLLRLRIPSEEFEAVRDEPPPETPGAAPAYDGTDLFSFL
jgi:hypothetical protein